ncbi:MAG TPA: MoxR family ATPase [Mycobacteriales bacterium]|nr:MoxR family ATPase [Mycobacteriales bacterium]
MTALPTSGPLAGPRHPADAPAAAPAADPAAGPTTDLARAHASQQAAAVVEALGRVVLGQRTTIEHAVTAVLAGGHVLLEDQPGTGKTLLARSLATVLGSSFRRVQATPELTAEDVTGGPVYDPASGALRFVPGPVFAHVVLVDELNRTPARTQAAFMEAMDERAVTVDGVRHALPDPHLVVATQNPLDHAGTYPLPEGQLDRFLVALSLGRLAPDVEADVVRARIAGVTEAGLAPVVDPLGLQVLQAHARATHVAQNILDYAVAIVRATRAHPAVELGASTRAAVGLVAAAQARTLLAGRAFVTADDVKALAAAVLGHRLVLRGRATGSGSDAGRALIMELLTTVTVPVGR